MKTLLGVIIAAFLLSVCTSKEKLSREEASSMIKVAFKYPRIIDYDIYSK